MRIGLIVDNPYRDLPGLVLVALQLCRRGCTCFLIPAALRTRETLSLVPDFVLLNNLRSDKEPYARKLLAAGIRMGVLDTEGGVFHDMEQYAKPLARDAAIRGAVSCFCSWGPKLARHAVDRGWYSQSQIVVTGAPRMDFYANSWREAALRMSAGGEAPAAPMVLINGNFSLANPVGRTAEEAASIKARNWGFDPEWVAGLQVAERRAMSEMVALANRLAERLPDVNFVYRPHPFEDPAAYGTLLASRPNLKLVKQGTVDGWILRARAVIQRGCSTAIEAAIAGIPALSPAWIKAPLDFETVDAVSLFCADEEEMIGKVRSAANGGLRVPEAMAERLGQVLSDWFFAVDGRAHERVAEAVMNAAAGVDASGPDLSRARDVLEGLLPGRPHWTTRARAAARRALGLSHDWSFRHMRNVSDLSWDRDERFFDTAAVAAVVDAIETRGEVQVGGALDRGEYRIPHRHGRTVTLSAREN